mgnify:CR=1 FL=1
MERNKQSSEVQLCIVFQERKGHHKSESTEMSQVLEEKRQWGQPHEASPNQGAPVPEPL